MIAVACLVIATSWIPAQPAEAATNWRWKECRFQYVNGRAGWQPKEVKRTIRCMAPKWGLSESLALSIAYRESRYLEDARNPSSGACGVFQHLPRYWDGRVAAIPQWLHPIKHSCFAGRVNILAGLYLAKVSGWHHWSV